MVTVAPPVAVEAAEPVKAVARKTGNPILPVAPVEGVPLRRFTLDEYHELIKIGFFDEDERIELLEGFLVSMSPIKPPHAYAVDCLLQLFASLLSRGEIRLRVQSPISIAKTESEPEPDLVIAKDLGIAYARRHPYPSEVLLVVEVADTTLVQDRTRKGMVYAQSAIAEYWILNLADESLEVYRDPNVPDTGDAVYQTKLTFHRGETVAPLAFPDFVVAIGDVLPPAENED